MVEPNHSLVHDFLCQRFKYGASIGISHAFDVTDELPIPPGQYSTPLTLGFADTECGDWVVMLYDPIGNKINTRYLDELRRNRPRSPNITVFDDVLIDFLRRYGLTPESYKCLVHHFFKEVQRDKALP